MENSRLSFMPRYRTLFLLSATKKESSSKVIQRQLVLKKYEPFRAMVHKLRKAMRNCDNRCALEGIIDIDEDYFTIEASEQVTEGPAWQQYQSNIIVMAESTILENLDTKKRKRHCRYFKAKVLAEH
jgi:hypothetical protein